MSAEQVGVVTVAVTIPIRDRGENVHGKGITDEEIARNVSYVLNIFLANYCQYLGAPTFGPIAANGIVEEPE